MSGARRENAIARPSAQFEDAARKPASKSQARRPAPVSLRLSADELDRLKAEAGRRSLNGYIRERLFGSAVNARRRSPVSVAHDPALLAKLLRDLGTWDMTWALRELDTAIVDGVIQLDITTCAAIRDACTDIRAMRLDLVRALGLRDREA